VLSELWFEDKGEVHAWRLSGEEMMLAILMEHEGARGASDVGVVQGELWNWLLTMNVFFCRWGGHHCGELGLCVVSTDCQFVGILL
jgi:hypothetical protein